MDSALIDALRQSVLEIASPSTSNERRWAATQFVEAQKEQNPNLHELGLYFASPHVHAGVDEPSALLSLRLFGLQLIEHCVRFRWNTYTPAEKDAMKSLLLGRLMCDTKDVREESKAIKEKIGVVMTEAVKREWPQHWLDLITNLMALSTQDSTRSDLVFTFFQVFIADVMEYDTRLPLDRKKDLKAGITDILPSLLNGLALTLSACVNEVRG